MLLGAAYADFRWHIFQLDSGMLLFAGGIGALIFFCASLSLLENTAWELHIDDQILTWKAGRKRGEIRIHRIIRMELSGSDERTIFVEMENGKRHKIPGECYGNDSDLIRWLDENLSANIELQRWGGENLRRLTKKS